MPHPHLQDEVKSTPLRGGQKGDPGEWCCRNAQGYRQRPLTRLAIFDRFADLSPPAGRGKVSERRCENEIVFSPPPFAMRMAGSENERRFAEDKEAIQVLP
jgi:hypothetical protein